MIDAVLLDVGGVFLAPDQEVIRPIIDAAGGDGSPTALDRAHYAGVAGLDAVGGVDWAEYLRALAATAGVPSEKLEAVVAALGEVLRGGAVWRRVLPGSADGLRRLADTGVGLGVVSNSDGTVAEQLVTARICQVGQGRGVEVAVVVDSAVAGYDKPDPRIFAIAIERLGVAADRMVHVGDTVFADVAGARAAGIRPLHLDPYDFCRSPKGDHEHVRSVAAVAELVLAERV
jgi:putative hydrolase of the HAD superfamily